nr:ORF8 [Bracoviriform inaniti]
MTKPEEACGSSGKANSMNSGNNNKTKTTSSSGELNPKNMFLATKYHDNVPEKVVVLHFDDLMMKQISSRKKTK